MDSFEEKIRIKYKLTREELYKILYHCDIIKTKGKRAVVQSVILGFAAIVFFWMYFAGDNEYDEYNLFFGIICLVVTAAIWIVPHIYLKRTAKEMSDKSISVEIDNEKINIGSGDGAWSIRLDGSTEKEEFEDILLIYGSGDKLLAIPKREVEPEIYDGIKKILSL